MLGWCADLFRLAWGLLYWNVRKTLFQRGRGRVPCPCQSPSDSGRAFETHCEACIHWSRPARFRRVCPLLVATKDGLRCSADTADVRAFWRIALGYYGGSAVALYAVGVLSVFVFLRTIGYPVSILHVGLPPLWHRVGQARSWFFTEKSNRALEAGRTSEGLLYLANAYEFDPDNYLAGLTLAKNYQTGQPAYADRIFEQLLRDHPDKSAATAQDWFRALLARGNFDQVASLARDQTLTDPAHAQAWMRALIFATRQMRNEAPLRELLGNSTPAAATWHPLLKTELALRAGRSPETMAALQRPWPNTPPFALFYQVSRLIELRAVYAALDLLESQPGVLDEEARVTLKLDAYATAGAQRLLEAEVTALLGPVRDLPRIKILCAHLIRHPNANFFTRLSEKVAREQLPLNTETAGAWFSLLCTAGAVGDEPKLRAYTTMLKQASKNPFHALTAVEAFFRGQTSAQRVTTFLPILPLPLEIVYALIERYEPAVPSLAGDAPARE